MTKKNILHILLAVFFFSLMQVFVKLLKGLPVFEIVFFRALIAFIICFILILKNKINPFGKNKKILFLRGFFGSLALICFFTTLHHLPLANATVIHYLSPLFTSFFSLFILKERLKSIQWLFFFLSFLGVVIIKGLDTRVPFFYLFLGILSAFFAGLAYNCIGKLKDTEHPLVIVLYFPLVTLPIITPFTVMNWVPPTSLQWVYILLVGIFVQAAQYFMTLAYQKGKVSSLSIFNNFGQVLAIVFGFYIFDEVVKWEQFLGMALVMGGVILNTLVDKDTKLSPL
tara:strand:- start:796 stop:1647 length:852 start_codon:yes stop_codon:yes gene_type:complete